MSVHAYSGAKFVRAIDGERVLLDFNFSPFGITYLALLHVQGIATPELVGPSAMRGLAAREKLRELVQGKDLQVFVDATELGRLWATIVVLPSSMEELDFDVSRRMVELGLAKPWEPNTPRPEFEPDVISLPPDGT